VAKPARSSVPPSGAGSTPPNRTWLAMSIVAAFTVKLPRGVCVENPEITASGLASTSVSGVWPLNST